MDVLIENDSILLSALLPIEVSWDGPPGAMWWDLSFGNEPPFDYSAEAVAAFQILVNGEFSDNVSPDTFLVGGFSFGDGLPQGTSRMLCRLRFYAESSLYNLCVKPAFRSPEGVWEVRPFSEVQIVPDFCGSEVIDPNDPVAPPKCF